MHAHYAKLLGSLPVLSFSGRQPEAAQLLNFNFHDLANDIIAEPVIFLNNRRMNRPALPNQ